MLIFYICLWCNVIVQKNLKLSFVSRIFGRVSYETIYLKFFNLKCFIFVLFWVVLRRCGDFLLNYSHSFWILIHINIFRSSLRWFLHNCSCICVGMYLFLRQFCAKYIFSHYRYFSKKIKYGFFTNCCTIFLRYTTRRSCIWVL